ncbi:hypothetical protein Acr_25g0004630 [Actinidia rufa]|uniref:Uncharacterized protein n=1 Tax=Actinidia rufa TaxID=165716 RepID=A0A7J0GZU7_9ERIC|nr:hypothetical protein Acr_25g0004630 [Actinidia rufa]
MECGCRIYDTGLLILGLDLGKRIGNTSEGWEFDEFVRVQGLWFRNREVQLLGRFEQQREIHGGGELGFGRQRIWTMWLCFEVEEMVVHGVCGVERVNEVVVQVGQYRL